MTASASVSSSAMILEAPGWRDYRLLDSGGGRKLEQVGPYRFIRPEAQALWAPEAPWDTAAINGEFVTSANAKDEDGGKWKLDPALPPSWEMNYDGIRFHASPTPFRHLGFFPEQAAHWEWCGRIIRDYIIKNGAPGAGSEDGSPGAGGSPGADGTSPQILNLFGYTGIASLHAARAGAAVTHVDSSKKAIGLAFGNRDLAGMGDAPIRFITEDARAFVRRESRRKRRYHGIILDPPKYGRGAGNEVWRMEDDIASLLAGIRAIIADEPLFVVLTAYAIRSSCLSLHHILDHVFGDMARVKVESGELALREDTGRGYRIGQAIFARAMTTAFA